MLLKSTFLFFLMLLTLNDAYSQSVLFSYANPPSSINGFALNNAWAGGLNSVQFGKIHLNNDSVPDLLVLDNISNKLYTYVFTASGYIYAPEFEFFMPPVRSWMVLADFNCDGKTDIFTRDPNVFNAFWFVKAYKNTSTNNNISFELAKSTLMYRDAQQFEKEIIVSVNEHPSILDVDGDGDLDLFNYDGTAQSGVHFFRNLSKETYGVCDSLVFEKYSSCYGKFTVGSDCNNMVNLNQGCTRALGGSGDPLSRMEHLGSSTTIFDLDKDGLFDVLTTDLNCTNTAALYNTGTNLQASITGVLNQFPLQNPINIPDFPLTIFEDIDNDGLKDLVVSPFVLASSTLMNFKSSIWYYRDTGTVTQGNSYKLITKSFLQETMIDVGENAEPVLTDYDADGDLDLFISNKGTLVGSVFKTAIALFENVGTISVPAFAFRTYDFDTLTQLDFRNIRFQFADINGDSTLDFCFIGYNISGFSTELNYIPNVAPKNQPFQFDKTNIQSIPVLNGAQGAFLLSTDDSPYFYDLNNDGFKDLIIGRFQGNMIAFTHNGNATAPAFNVFANPMLGLASSTTNQQLVAKFANLNHPDTTELVTIDETGVLKVYSNVSVTGNSLPTANISVIYNLNNTLAYPSQFGRFASFDIADLNADGFKDIIVGLGTGGVVILYNVRATTPINPAPIDTNKVPVKNISSAQAETTLLLAPNPCSGSCSATFSEPGILSIYNALGVCVYEQSVIPDRHALPLLGSGIYVVTLTTSNNRSVQRLVIP